jgi:hypothetical protein
MTGARAKINTHLYSFLCFLKLQDALRHQKARCQEQVKASSSLVKRCSAAEVALLMTNTSCGVKEDFINKASDEMQDKQKLVGQIFHEIEQARASFHARISSVLRQLPENMYTRGMDEAKKEIRKLNEEIERKIESSEAMKVSNVRIQVSKFSFCGCALQYKRMGACEK